jgi:hypothetical protein
MPGVLAKTDAQPGDKNWDAIAAAAASFGQDWCAVVNREADITIVNAGGTGTIPHPPLVEVMKRDIIALWRGGDLSTLSATTGQGQGASVQDGEGKLLQEDDARFVTEKLNAGVDPQVIAYHFGVGVKPLAYFKLIAPNKPDTERELKVDGFFLQNSLPLDRADLYERYSRRMPDPKADPEGVVVGRPVARTAPAGAAPDPAGAPAALQNAIQLLNAAADAADEQAEEALREAALDDSAQALADVLAPVRKRMEEIAAMGDAVSQREAIAALRRDLPNFLKQAGTADAELATAFERLIGTSYVNGLLAVPPAEKA